MVCRPLLAGCGPSPRSDPRWCWCWRRSATCFSAAARPYPRGSSAAARVPGGHRGDGHPARHRPGGHRRHHRRRRGPAPAARQAVTVAFAAALQESELQNLDFGDRDSVGVFQQRPSQGWGTTAELEDPVYATTKFFAALVRVPGYTKMPVDRAAQDVQHSADGSAYEQWVEVATLLAGYFTGA